MASSEDLMLKNYDDVQNKLMEEECILINEDDVNIGTATKKNCHLWTNIQKGMLHRAFSVFLFNTKDELLLQQRSMSKITYPGHWSNTCCSHPLNFPAELDESDSFGVLRAAQRKLKHELGIEAHEVPIESMKYVTRIHYKSQNVPNDGLWGEHEIDYVIFVRRDVTLHVNDAEVKDVCYMTKADVQSFIDNSRERAILISPWFRLIVTHFLPTWWDNLQDLRPCLDHRTIHRMIECQI